MSVIYKSVIRDITDINHLHFSLSRLLCVLQGDAFSFKASNLFLKFPKQGTIASGSAAASILFVSSIDNFLTHQKSKSFLLLQIWYNADFFSY